MLHALIERLSDHPRFFLFCRGILESNFTVIRQTIRTHLTESTDSAHSPATAVDSGHHGNGGQRRVIDVACGPGAFSDLFSSEAYTGIDLNPKYVSYAKENYRGIFEVQDARELSFPDAAFDDALVYGLLHHLDDDDVARVAKSLRRVLRPGGRALVIEDIPTESRLNLVGHLLHWAENGHYIRPAGHYRALLAPHFRIEEEDIFRSGVCDYYMARLTADDGE